MKCGTCNKTYSAKCDYRQGRCPHHIPLWQQIKLWWRNKMSGKGSNPRPFSVTQEEFGNRFETIFGKKNKMTPAYKDNGEDVGTCGCGRSPTGKCIGWHGLTEDDYKKRLEEFNKQQGSSPQQ